MCAGSIVGVAALVEGGAEGVECVEVKERVGVTAGLGDVCEGAVVEANAEVAEPVGVVRLRVVRRRPRRVPGWCRRRRAVAGTRRRWCSWLLGGFGGGLEAVGASSSNDSARSGMALVMSPARGPVNCSIIENSQRSVPWSLIVSVRRPVNSPRGMPSDHTVRVGSSISTTSSSKVRFGSRRRPRRVGCVHRCGWDLGCR